MVFVFLKSSFFFAECKKQYKNNTFQLSLTTSVDADIAVAIDEEAKRDDGGRPGSGTITQRKTLLHEMISVVESLVKDFCSHSPVEREAVCPNCMKSQPSGPFGRKEKTSPFSFKPSPPPFVLSLGMFSLETLVQLFTSNKSRASCGVCNELIPVALVAPDITFSFLPVVENLTLDALIGRGGFGLVYRGILADGTVVAVKEMLVNEDVEVVVERFRQFQHEVCMMSLVNHPNLVRLFGVMLQPRPRIVMEFCPLPDLSQMLYGKKKDTILSYSQKIAIAFDVASALA